MAHDIASEGHFEAQERVCLGESGDGQQEEECSPENSGEILAADW